MKIGNGKKTRNWRGSPSFSFFIFHRKPERLETINLLTLFSCFSVSLLFSSHFPLPFEIIFFFFPFLTKRKCNFCLFELHRIGRFWGKKKEKKKKGVWALIYVWWFWLRRSRRQRELLLLRRVLIPEAIFNLEKRRRSCLVTRIWLFKYVYNLFNCGSI